jgi:hypothetical protein
MRRILPLLLLLAFSACQDENIPAVPLAGTPDRAYLPQQVGQYAVYRVEQVRHFELIPDVPSTFYVKQVLAAAAPDGPDTLYRLERFRRESPQADWALDSVWTARLDGRRWVQSENNVPFVKLLLPLNPGDSWDGNAFNARPSESYTLESAGEPLALLGDLSFDETATVVQQDFYTLINKDYRKEVYARGVGLVLKEWEVYQYINDSQSPFYAQDSIVGGLFYRETLIEYGQE